MWYCLKCDATLDEFQIVYDKDNRPKCGICRGDVEQVDVCTHGISMEPTTREGAKNQEDNKGVIAARSPPINADDNGLSIVDHYVGLLKAKQDLEAEIEEARSKIIEFVEKCGASTINGSTKQLHVKRIDQVYFPEDKEPLINHMKKTGLFDEYAMLNCSKIRSAIQNESMDPSVLGYVKVVKDYRLSLTKR